MNTALNKKFFSYVIPSILAFALSGVYTIVDGFFIGQSLGDTGLTAITLGYPISALIGAVGTGLGLSGAIRFTILNAQGETQKRQECFSGTTLLMLLTAGLLTAILFAFAQPILHLLGARGNMLMLCVMYAQVIALGAVFQLLATGFVPFIRNMGGATVAMIAMAFGFATNIALDYVFVWAMNWGMAGAAWATIIGQAVTMIVAVIFFLVKKSVISVCFNSSLLKYGDDIAVGAMTILSSVMQFAMLPLQGIAQGAQPITSYNYGARNTQRVRQTFRLLLKVCLCYSVALWVVIQLCPGAFARIFTPNAALVAFTVPALRIYCGALFLFGIQIACQMTFVSIGAAGCSIIVAVLRKFVLLLPLIYLMPRLLADQTMAVYTAEPVADAIAVTCTAILFAVQFRKALRKLDAED